MPKPRFIAFDATFGRRIWLLQLDDLRATFDLHELHNEKFVCLCVMDANSIGTNELSAFCSRLIDLGCSYYCAWGPDCECVHDTMDEVIIGDKPPETYIGCVMTTWHARESLAEAVDFFLTCTVPDEQYAPSGCSCGLAVVIGSAEWATQIEHHVREATATA